MYKNVSLRSRVIDGRPTWRLLGPDGEVVDAFTVFAQSLKNSAANTRDSYCRHMAEFMDYFYEATVLIGKGRSLTKLELHEVIGAYADYLSMGLDAKSPIARDIATQLPPGINKSTSIPPKTAALRRFLHLSEEFRKELLERAVIEGEANFSISSNPLTPELGKRRPLRPNEVKALKMNSMFAGVIAHGPKLVSSVVFADDWHSPKPVDTFHSAV